MAKNKNKNNRYWRAEMEFEDNSAIYGDKCVSFKECIPQLNHFLINYGNNRVSFSGIKKYYGKIEE